MSVPRFTAMRAAKNEESDKFAEKCGETFQQFNAKGSNFLSNSFGQRKISGGFMSPGSSPTLAHKFFHASTPENQSSVLSSAKNWLHNWRDNC